MVELFEIDGDESDWLQSLSKTQRSESINSFFDKYVNRKTSLKEFVDQYKLAAQGRKEAKNPASCTR